MKNKSVSQSALIGLFAVLTFALCSSPVQASTTWTDTSGNWFTGTNWSNGVPTCSLNASINNDGKAAINSSGATALSLTLGYNAADSGTVSVDGGTLLVRGCPGLPVLGDIYVGDQGTGTLSITNGGYVTSGSGYIAAVQGELTTPNGSVTVTGSGSTWQVGDVNNLYSVLFVGGNETNDGGTALLSITDGGSVTVQNNGSETPVTVGPSGTLTGNGTLDTTNSSTSLTTVTGTLEPSGGQLTIVGDLAFSGTSPLMQTNVVPTSEDNVNVTSGTATLTGRLAVTMTGTFTSGATYTLLTADGGLNETTFSSVSITYPPVPTYTPVITYDAHNVHLYLRPN